MDICIVTKDAIVGRFISLELKEAGYSAMESDCIKDGASLYICDLDSISEPVPDGAVGFSYDGGKARFVQTFLQRPVDIVKLRDAVSKKFSVVYLKNEKEILSVDRSKRVVNSSKGEVHLSKKELALLEVLCKKELLKREHGGEIFGNGDSNVVDVYIHYLRKKLTSVCNTDPIRSKRGEGYFLSDSLDIRLI